MDNPMIGPGWLADVLAAIVIGVALFSAVRLIVSHGWQGRGQHGRSELDADIVHVFMGVAMAGMFVPGLATLPTAAWEVVFAVGTAWFAWRALRARHPALAPEPGHALAEEPGYAVAGEPGYAVAGEHAHALAGEPGHAVAGEPRRAVAGEPRRAVAGESSHSSLADLASHSGHSGRSGRAGIAGHSGLVGRLGYSGHYCRYPLPHLIDSVAMLYMLWAVSDLRSTAGRVSGGMSGMGGGAAHLPFLGLILALCICGYVVWLGDRIPASASAGRPVHDRDRLLALSAGQSVTIMDDSAGSETVAGLAGRSLLVGGPLLAPRAAICCKIAMGVAMGVMLIDLL